MSLATTRTRNERLIHQLQNGVTPCTQDAVAQVGEITDLLAENTRLRAEVGELRAGRGAFTSNA